MKVFDDELRAGAAAGIDATGPVNCPSPDAGRRLQKVRDGITTLEEVIRVVPLEGFNPTYLSASPGGFECVADP